MQRPIAGLPLALVAIAAAALIGSCARAPSENPRAEYVGRAACAGCHAGEARRFAGSRHDLAMQPADSTTVLGDFGGATFERNGVRTVFHRRGGRYFVTTEGPDGRPGEFEVAYTFGVYPLQQYLIPMPGGRHQALTLAWDARPRAAGGQRWFDLYPDERIPAGDMLHWTGPAQNWNAMCADCHSTNLRKGWDAAAGAYRTTFSEIDVSCEACHGPGSAHVVWAKRVKGKAPRGVSIAEMGLVADLREPAARWLSDSATGIARRERPRQSHAEVELCARCHARRSPPFADAPPGSPLLDTHRPSLLEEGLYFADGQQRDEVYEYGSFLQSRMYAAGVTCSDCHDPHRGGLRAATPDEACARCHAPARFASRAHHGHDPARAGGRCVACHMPGRTYMVVDPRRDHSIRVPRPDLSGKLGTPNACDDCHRDRGAAWAQRAVARWYPDGRWRRAHDGAAIAVARRFEPGAERGLVALANDLGAPGIVRATAMRELAERPGPATRATIERGTADRDGLVRLAALDAIELLPAADRARLGAAALSDPLRGVRLAAVSALAADRASLPPDRQPAFDAAAHEYRAAQAANRDRPESSVNLGAFEIALGDPAAARAAYEQGLRAGPWLSAVWVNLADLLRGEGRDEEGEQVLRRALGVAADSAVIHHALGLNLARQHRGPEALAELRRAHQLDPANVRYAYVYGVALLSEDRGRDGITVLESALAGRPGDPELLVALATACRDLGDRTRAREYARRLVRALPDDPAARQLLAEIEGAAPPR